MAEFIRQWEAAGLAPVGELSEADHTAVLGLTTGKWKDRWRDVIKGCTANAWYREGEGRRLGRLTLKQLARFDDAELEKILDYRPGRPRRSHAEEQADYMAEQAASIFEGRARGGSEDPLAVSPPPPAEDPIPALVEAIAEACGVDASVMFKTVQGAALSLAQGKYTAADVAEFARRFSELCPWATTEGRQWPHVRELTAHICKLRAKPAVTTKHIQDAY